VTVPAPNRHPAVVLHVAPHPDDELLGAGCTLLQLRDCGHHIVDAIVSLGRPEEHDVRRREAEAVAARVGFELVLPDTPFSLSSRDARRSSLAELRDFVATTVDRVQPDVVVSPSPHDGHPAHELVGGAVRDAVELRAGAIIWWMWGLWSELPITSLYAPIREEVLAEASAALELHASQVARRDFVRLLRARAAASAVLGVERVFGFGAAVDASSRHAELLCEAVWVNPDWELGEARVLDPVAPTTDPHGVSGGPDIGSWLHQPSASRRVHGG